MPFLKDFLINNSTKIILWKIIPGELSETHLSKEDIDLIKTRKGKNSKEYLREIEQDLNEGADAIIIKPALAYLDIINVAKTNYNTPIIAYNVSGEYSMIKSSAENGHINEIEVVLETIYAMKRAGANAIITYYALELSKNLKY